MKGFLVFAAIVACTQGSALFRSADPLISIRTLNHEINPLGAYAVSHEDTAGTIVRESGNSISKSGDVSYISPEGERISLSYVADEHGFRPVGSHLPVPPPMPAEIRAMLPTLPKLVEVDEIRRPSFLLEEIRRPLVVEEIRRPLISSQLEPTRVLISSSGSLIDNSHILIRDSLPSLPLPLFREPLLIQEAAPEKTLVQTDQFLIDSSMAKTHIKIGS